MNFLKQSLIFFIIFETNIVLITAQPTAAFSHHSSNIKTFPRWRPISFSKKQVPRNPPISEKDQQINRLRQEHENRRRYFIMKYFTDHYNWRPHGAWRAAPSASNNYRPEYAQARIGYKPYGHRSPVSTSSNDEHKDEDKPAKSITRVASGTTIHGQASGAHFQSSRIGRIQHIKNNQIAQNSKNNGPSYLSYWQN